MGRSETLRHWTDKDVARLIELKNSDNGNKEIASILDRSILSITQKFSKIRKSGEMGAYVETKSTAKRKYVKKDKTMITHQLPMVAAPTPHTRPMIALVGTPAEVTQTIRELFS